MKITVRGDKYEVKIVDPTHITTRVVGGTGTAWAFHVAQLDDETVKQLQAAGVMDERRYVKEEDKEEKKLRSLLEAIRKTSFTPDYQSAATDEELLGLLLSRHFKWDGLAILRTAYAALEDSNFHSDNEVIQGLIDKYAEEVAV